MKRSFVISQLKMFSFDTKSDKYINFLGNYCVVKASTKYEIQWYKYIFLLL